MNTNFGQLEQFDDFYYQHEPLLKKTVSKQTIEEYENLILELKNRIIVHIDAKIDSYEQKNQLHKQIEKLEYELKNNNTIPEPKQIITQEQLKALMDELNNLRNFKNKFTNQHVGRRPKKILVDKINDIKDLKSKGYTNNAIAKLYNVSETTIRRYLKK